MTKLVCPYNQCIYPDNNYKGESIIAMRDTIPKKEKYVQKTKRP